MSIYATQRVQDGEHSLDSAHPDKAREVRFVAQIL